MNRMVKWVCLALVVLYIATAMSAGRIFDVGVALAEYFRRTTIEGNYLPPGCIAEPGPLPPNLLRIIQEQRDINRLALQRVVGCRSPNKLPEFEAHSIGLRSAFGERNDCRPLYNGCCSCEFGRHVMVLAAESRDDGSVLVQANLIRSRWDYLRLKWNRVRLAWLEVSGLLLVVLILMSLAGGWMWQGLEDRISHGRAK